MVHINNNKKNQKEKEKDNKVMLNTVPGILLSLFSHYNFQVIFGITNENGFPWAVGWEKSLSLSSVQFSSITQSCPTLCDPMNHSTPGLPVHRQLLEFTHTHVHRVSDAIQLSHPLFNPSTPAFNLSQHQGLFKWVSFSHHVAKVLEFQLQHQSFQWTPRTDLL